MVLCGIRHSPKLNCALPVVNIVYSNEAFFPQWSKYSIGNSSQVVSRLVVSSSSFSWAYPFYCHTDPSNTHHGTEPHASNFDWHLFHWPSPDFWVMHSLIHWPPHSPPPWTVIILWHCTPWPEFVGHILTNCQQPSMFLNPLSSESSRLCPPWPSELASARDLPMLLCTLYIDAVCVRITSMGYSGLSLENILWQTNDQNSSWCSMH